MVAKHTKRTAVVDARLNVAQAAERLAAEKRSQAEEERSKQVRCLCTVVTLPLRSGHKQRRSAANTGEVGCCLCVAAHSPPLVSALLCCRQAGQE